MPCGGPTGCPRARYAAGRSAARSVGDASRGGRPGLTLRAGIPSARWCPRQTVLFAPLPSAELCSSDRALLPPGVLLLQLPALPGGPWAAWLNRRGPAAYLCRCGSVWAVSADTLLFPAGSGNLAAQPASKLSARLPAHAYPDQVRIIKR